MGGWVVRAVERRELVINAMGSSTDVKMTSKFVRLLRRLHRHLVAVVGVCCGGAAVGGCVVGCAPTSCRVGFEELRRLRSVLRSRAAGG